MVVIYTRVCRTQDWWMKQYDLFPARYHYAGQSSVFLCLSLPNSKADLCMYVRIQIKIQIKLRNKVANYSHSTVIPWYACRIHIIYWYVQIYYHCEYTTLSSYIYRGYAKQGTQERPIITDTKIASIDAFSAYEYNIPISTRTRHKLRPATNTVASGPYDNPEQTSTSSRCIDVTNNGGN